MTKSQKKKDVTFKNKEKNMRLDLQGIKQIKNLILLKNRSKNQMYGIAYIVSLKINNYNTPINQIY